MGCIQRYIVYGFRMDTRVFCAHGGVAESMATFTFVGFEIFSYGLPGCRPEIFGSVVTDIDIASRLVKLVKDIAQDATVCSGTGKAVATRIVGNDGPIFRGSQIVNPGSRCVGAGNNVFPVVVVEISVIHNYLPVLFLFLI